MGWFCSDLASRIQKASRPGDTAETATASCAFPVTRAAPRRGGRHQSRGAGVQCSSRKQRGEQRLRTLPNPAGQHGKDVLVESAAFLSATERLGTGIANIHVRLPMAAESASRMLSALHPGRFVLGLGVSHAPFVEQTVGSPYSKPLTRALASALEL